MGIRSDFIKDTLVFGLGNGIKKFIGIFLLPFYTRVLTPADYGILDSVATFSLLFSAIINLGLDSSSGFYFFKTLDENEKGKILYTHLVLKLLSAIPPLILSFFSAKISILLFSTDSYTWIVFLSIIIVPVNLLMNEQSQIYRYYRKPWGYNIITITKSLTNIGIGISLVVILKWGVLGAQLASMISSFVVVLGSFILFTREKYLYSFNWCWAKKMIGYGFPLIWSGLAVWIFNSSDRFFLLHFSTLDSIGFYSIGTTFSQPIGLINMAVQMSFGVLFYKVYYEEENPLKLKSKTLATESFNIYLGVAVLIASFLSIFGIDLVNLITTKQYSPGALAIPFLTFAAIAAQGFQTMGPGIELSEKTWHFVWIAIVTALTSISLNFILVPKLSYIGAGISYLVSFTVQWIIKVIVSQHYFRIKYSFLKIFFYFSLSLAISLILVLLKPSVIELRSNITKVIAFTILILVGNWLGFLPVKTLLKKASLLIR